MNNNDLNDKENANIEHHWAKLQLEWCDLQFKLLQSGDRRLTVEVETLKKYARDLRDYTSCENGQAIIKTDKPKI